MNHHNKYHYELEILRREEIAIQNAQRDVMNALARHRQSVQNIVIENNKLQINGWPSEFE